MKMIACVSRGEIYNSMRHNLRTYLLILFYCEVADGAKSSHVHIYFNVLQGCVPCKADIAQSHNYYSYRVG